MGFNETEHFEAFWNALNLENLTEAEYLDRILGPKYLSPKLVIPLTLAYVTIFVTGVVGNVITCTVIVKNSVMHTPTNYYLFSLTISDLILLTLGLPNELSIFWQQYPWALGVGLCKIRAYVSEMSSYVSVLTIVAFSLERYLAICHPLRVYAASAMKRPSRFILAAWLIALVSAIPFAVYTKLNYVEYPPGSGNTSADSAICAMLLPDMPIFPLYELSCLVFFFIPMFVLIALYTRMGLRIRESTKDPKQRASDLARSSDHWNSRQVRARKTVVKMLSAVVIMFFICWAPFHAQRLLYVHAQEADYYPDLNEWLYILSGCLYYFSTTVNPILYNLMSARYREAFKRTVCQSRAQRTLGLSPTTLNHKTSTKEYNISRCKRNWGKGILSFRGSSEQQESSGEKRDSKDSNFPDDNRQDKPLLSSKHPIAGQQLSNESSLSKNRLQQTFSTTSSML